MLWDLNGINVQVDCYAGCSVVSKIIDPILETFIFRIPCRHWNWQLACWSSWRVDWLHEEFQLCASKESSKNDIQHLRHLKEVWTKSPDGGRWLQKKRDKMKWLDVEIMNQSLDDASISIKYAERNQMNNEINTLTISRDGYTKQIADWIASWRMQRVNWICSQRIAEAEKSHFTHPSIEYSSQLEQTDWRCWHLQNHGQVWWFDWSWWRDKAEVVGARH